MLRDGSDPSKKAKQDKYQQHLASISTFNGIADELLEKDAREGKAETTLAKKRWLIGLAKADLGHLPITEIKAPAVLVVLREVEAAGNYETARRLRAVISQVFRYAVATSRAENDPTSGLKGALTAPTVTYRAAMPIAISSLDWSRRSGPMTAQKKLRQASNCLRSFIRDRANFG